MFDRFEAFNYSCHSTEHFIEYIRSVSCVNGGLRNWGRVFVLPICFFHSLRLRFFESRDAVSLINDSDMIPHSSSITEFPRSRANRRMRRTKKWKWTERQRRKKNKRESKRRTSRPSENDSWSEVFRIFGCAAGFAHLLRAPSLPISAVGLLSEAEASFYHSL